MGFVPTENCTEYGKGEKQQKADQLDAISARALRPDREKVSRHTAMLTFDKVRVQTRTREIPVKVDLATGKITCEKRVSLQFRIKFDRPIIRNPVLYPSTEEKA